MVFSGAANRNFAGLHGSLEVRVKPKRVTIIKEHDGKECRGFAAAPDSLIIYDEANGDPAKKGNNR